MANFHQLINVDLLALMRDSTDPVKTTEPKGLSSHDFAIVDKYDVAVGNNILVGKLINGWPHVQLVFTIASITFEGIGVDVRAFRPARTETNTDYYPWVKIRSSKVYLIEMDDWKQIKRLHDVSKVLPTARNPDSGLAAEYHAAFRALLL